ncbi:MAG: hypothetical protein ACYDDF_11535 [Thermoplasmatota archaeon]
MTGHEDPQETNDDALAVHDSELRDLLLEYHAIHCEPYGHRHANDAALMRCITEHLERSLANLGAAS